MIEPAPLTYRGGPGAIRRLGTIAPLGDGAVAALQAAAECPVGFIQRANVMIAGAPVTAALLLLEGWMARVSILPDGRRQILGFILPGELIGRTGRPAPADVVAVTGALACRAPNMPALAAAYSASRVLEEAQMIAQITRLGRLSALERIADIFVELYDRLNLAGLADQGRFALPVTQEGLADALGLTSVHVNRMVQQARQAGILGWKNGIVTLHDLPAVRAITKRAAPAIEAQAAA